MHPHEAEFRETIRAAKELQANVHASVKDFPPEAADLKRKLCAAADRAVENLELALAAWQRDNAANN